VKLTVPDISSIEPLGKVFDFIYGRRYFALSTFLRVAAITTVAFSCLILLAKFRLSLFWDVSKHYWNVFLPLFIGNIFFYYLSITKSRFALSRIARLKLRFSWAIFFIVDLALTFIIVLFYTAIWYSLLEKSEPLFGQPTMGFFVFYIMISSPLLNAFQLTTFLNLLLTTVYSVSLMLLMFFNFLGKTAYMRWLVPENILSILRWVLPVKTLPVRSIGIVAGAFVFIFVAAFHAVR
jgi:hypothetical protein